MGPRAANDAVAWPPDTPEPPADALILSLCRRVRQLETATALNDAAWDSAVRQLSTMPAQTAAGLLAKARLLRGLQPTAPGSSGARWLSPDEQLLASLLDDLLGTHDETDPVA